MSNWSADPQLIVHHSPHYLLTTGPSLAFNWIQIFLISDLGIRVAKYPARLRAGKAELEQYDHVSIFTLAATQRENSDIIYVIPKLVI